MLMRPAKLLGSLRTGGDHLKSTWAHCGSHETFWTHLHSLAFTWSRLHSHRFTWTRLDSRRFTWAHLKSPGPTWALIIHLTETIDYAADCRNEQYWNHSKNITSLCQRKCTHRITQPFRKDSLEVCVPIRPTVSGHVRHRKRPRLPKNQ